MEKALAADRLEVRNKNLLLEIKVQDEQNKANLARVESSLAFSREANQNLKNDYDLLQEKFDKHMKATNNLNQDLKDDI